MIYTDSKSNIRFIEVFSSSVTKKNARNLPVLSLFSGAGGLDIGLERGGFATAACVEYDADCRATLRYNRPEWRLFESDSFLTNGQRQTRLRGDIRDIGAEELLEFAGLQKGETALVVGGAPCQPFSNIGKRLGANDKKNGDLFLEFARIVHGVNPEAFIFENVVGITQKKHTEVVQYMVDKFQGLGYGIAYGVLNAANYGVPQRRERFFLIGVKGCDAPAFPLPTHFKDERHYENFAKTLGGAPLKFQQWTSVRKAFETLTRNQEDRSDYALMNISDLVKNRMTYIKEGQNFKALPMELRPHCWKSGKHQGNDTFGRMIADMPACTIRTAAYNPAKGQYIHPFENRGLSTVEMAALQSFPLDWRFRCEEREKITLVSAGRQIGNAVPPPLAEALGAAVKSQILRKNTVSRQKRFKRDETN